MATPFNADILLNTAVEGANATKIPNLPEGSDYIGQVVDIAIKNGADKDGKAYTRLELQVEVTADQEPRVALMELDKKRVRVDALLDINEQGTLDMSASKNVNLGRLREAMGLNDPSRKFSIGMFRGQMIKFDIAHNPSKDDPEVVYERAVRVRPV